MRSWELEPSISMEVVEQVKGESTMSAAVRPTSQKQIPPAKNAGGMTVCRRSGLALICSCNGHVVDIDLIRRTTAIQVYLEGIRKFQTVAGKQRVMRHVHRIRCAVNR